VEGPLTKVLLPFTASRQFVVPDPKLSLTMAASGPQPWVRYALPKLSNKHQDSGGKLPLLKGSAGALRSLRFLAQKAGMDFGSEKMGNIVVPNEESPTKTRHQTWVHRSIKSEYFNAFTDLPSITNVTSSPLLPLNARVEAYRAI
jgi:hypothetical protein